ncbi:type II toxin-antitoxin system PemK/MazF family toxin [Candidatus Thiodictyon syntrophicum]|uniref:Growth inhibitor PemK n=1 Tax=Candidatus Thiodictyon syntrophicum TaxID=1166950 RepID=A0A2K8U983_9GAMM|nr:type II toxin-antitoxin system PemK/MazF family toxin [Candidatus Thiodictyon syntrophicum]AUB81591.1 growth inhibitor PemK [Candidatus Thiodictyon syntrophicum]
MPLPEPHPGLVIGYRYLWDAEAQAGHEEGRKNRPCIVVLTVMQAQGGPVVTVAPITHAAPRDPDCAVEVPLSTKRRLGLDAERSWVLVSEVNRFVWPGPDLVPISRAAPGRYDYGVLPPRLFAQVVERLVTVARSRKAKTDVRTD